MSRAAGYSDRVRRLFDSAAHAGDADGPAVLRARGDARVKLSAELRAGRIAALRFRVYGCPHLIAAAEDFCERFEGRKPDSLQEFTARDAVEKLGAPVAKTGTMLLLEDAVRALGEAIEAGPGRRT